ncbi:class F sortase [Thermopolyspora sp. NPDC052614]|uniref:class F sortase n=1 Tax=Thermopolyspora sp. NPDC052614 TaxID=3155682 RepID=UPI00342EA55E
MTQWKRVVVAGVLTGTVLYAIVGRDGQEKKEEIASARVAAVTPQRIDIPSLKLDAPLMKLGLTKEGDVELPPYEKPQMAGWYKNSVVPGERGASVIIGHVDTKKAAAVFYRLREVRKGAVVKVTRSDGKVARYRVDKVEQIPKNRFPAERVYLEDGLRLVTCGGTFDWSQHQYRDNIIVYASLIT